MFCPKCSKEITENQAFCASCGTALSEATQQGAPGAAAGTGKVVMFCRNCGKEVTQNQQICVSCGASPTSGTSFCNGCGASTNALAEVCVKCGIRLAKAKKLGVSDKSRLVITLLCGLLGLVLFIGGIHRLYLGKTGTGVTMLVLSIVGWATCWLFVGFFFMAGVWIWSLIDFIFAVSGKMKDKNGDPVTVWVP